MVGGPELEWTEEDANIHRLAYDLLTEMIAAVDAHIDAALALPQPLVEERAFLVEKRRTLSVLDRDETRRVADTYPQRLRELRLGD